MKCTSILDLPDEVLLDVMSHLDFVSLYLLSQTTGRFLRLSRDDTFRNSGLTARSYLIACRRKLWGEPVLETIFTLLRRDLFCARCLEARARSSFSSRARHLREMLPCRACLTSHPRYQFPRDQREASDRVCVGRVGRMSVCPHMAFGWDHVKRWAKGLPSRDYTTRHITCCECPNQDPRCGDAEPEIIYASVEMEMAEDARERPVRRRSPKPRLYPLLTITRSVALGIEWPDDGELDSTTLRDILRDSAKKGQVDSVFCPHVRLGDSQPVVGLIGNLTQQARGAVEPECRSHSPSPRPQGATSPARSAEYAYLCCLCDTYYKFTLSGAGLKIIFCAQRRLADPKKPWWEQTPDEGWWVRQLDREAYEREDDEGRHVTWCPDPACYPRARWGPESRLVRFADVLRSLDDEPVVVCYWDSIRGYGIT